jgi:hypothetical protein
MTRACVLLVVDRRTRALSRSGVRERSTSLWPDELVAEKRPGIEERGIAVIIMCPHAVVLNRRMAGRAAPP